MISVEVISNDPVADGAYLLEVPRIFTFRPGQVVNVHVNGFAPRMYSIASSPVEDVLRLLYDIKPGGEVTPLLQQLKKGDSIGITGPLGSFSCEEGPGYWIANGTGIAPFYSMFRSGLADDKVLIQGARTLRDFYFQDELLGHFPSGNYVRCSSQDKAEGLYHGRLTTFLNEQKDLPLDQKYYLCGSTEMVVDVRDILIAKGIPFGNIIAEIYF